MFRSSEELDSKILNKLCNFTLIHRIYSGNFVSQRVKFFVSAVILFVK